MTAPDDAPVVGTQWPAPGVNVGRIRDGRTVEMWSYTADQHAVDEFWS